MTSAELLKYGAYFIANLSYTYVLVWGFRSVSGIIKEPVQNGTSTSQITQSAGLLMLSSVRSVAPAANNSGNQHTSSKPLDLSYAKVSGAIGSIAIAALFVGLSYFILFGLFFSAESEIDVGKQINGLQVYFLAGAALFLPYAFESLTGIFKP